MNVIEALKQSKSCRVIKDGRIARVNTSDYLCWVDNKKIVLVADLLRDNWMPFKEEKKELVVKNVTWHNTGNIIYPSSFHRSNNLEDSNSWDEVLNKPLMTMTLTWEE